MFCQSCGTPVGDSSVAACAQCGHVIQRAGGNVASDLGRQVKGSSRDAATVLKVLLANPVGGLGAAHAALGADRALGAGIVLCVGFAMAAAAGIVLGAGQWLGVLGGFIGVPEGFGGFLTLTFRFLVVPVSITAVGFGLRRMAGANPGVAADFFTTGAALTPAGLAMLLSGIIGVRNFEIAVLLFFFALTYLSLMLYAGFTRVGGMSERGAAPAVPVALLLAGWLCKVVMGSVAGPLF